MAERFVTKLGTISIASGASTVTGSGTTFSGRDREGAQLWAYPESGASIHVGTVAAVDPRGIYENLELPLVSPYWGPTLSNVAYELIDGPAIANGAVQAAIFVRFSAYVEGKFGLTGRLSDVAAEEWNLIPNNMLFWDSVTKAFYQWHNSVLEQLPFNVLGNPKGEWSSAVEYSKLDMVEHGGFIFLSNADENENNEPDDAPGSGVYWTWLPLPSGLGDIYAVAWGTNDRPGDGEELPPHVFTDTATLPEDCALSQAWAGGEATASAVITFKKNGVAVATVTYDAESNTGVFASDDPVTFEAGDILVPVCPSPRDDTLAKLAITLRLQR